MVAIASKNNSSSKVAANSSKKSTKKKCSKCNEEKSIKDFYMSYSKLHSDGRMHICKDCCKVFCFNEDTEEYDVEKVKSLFRQIDRPFIDSLWESAINESKRRSGEDNFQKSLFSIYIKNVNMSQYKALDWQGGIEWNMRTDLPSSIATKIRDKSRSQEEIFFLPDGEFDVTPDIIRLFGEGYTAKEYKMMYDKYEFLKQNYPNLTNLHVESLVTYIRFKVKEEQATALGNTAEADKWATLAQKAGDKAKINPNQLSQSDLQGGLNSFSEIFQALERTVDFIPILPRFKYRPNDAPDFIIWCLINYLRKMEGKPLCEYEDVYRFYDERKEEYVAQYGDPYNIFNDDTSLDNREKIKQFITLPPDYEDGE